MNEPHEPKPTPLNYATPTRTSHMPYLAQFAMGFASFLAWLVLTALVTVALAGLADDLAGPVAMFTVGFALVALGTAIVRRHWHWPGFLAGVLIGFALLPAGLYAVLIARL